MDSFFKKLKDEVKEFLNDDDKDKDKTKDKEKDKEKDKDKKKEDEHTKCGNLTGTLIFLECSRELTRPV
jgi:hypothetical protein